jgi:hypothetical protein
MEVFLLNRREKFKEQLKKKSKFETIKSIIMSFTATVAAVVAVVVLVPTSPIAKIESVKAFTTDIVYQVNVTDQDGAITNDTLKVVLENQSEYHEVLLEPGLSAGSFSNLNPNTKYTLSVRYDKGFGLEKLATETIQTMEKDGAAFLGVSIIDSNYDYYIPYQIDIYYTNQSLTYQNLVLYIAQVPYYQVEDPIYEPYVIDLEGTSSITLDVMNENTRVLAYLEATTTNNELIVLDELEFQTPLSIYASFYVDQIRPDGFGVSFYSDDSSTTEISYEVMIKQNKQTIKTVTPPQFEEGTQHGESLWIISGLRDETLYTLELYATYSDPITLQPTTRLIETFEETTISKFSYTIDIKDLIDIYEVTITLDDPGHNYQIANYTTYQPSEDYDMWLDSGQSPFNMIDNVKTATLIIPKTYPSPYYIEIYVSSETDYRYYITIQTIFG